MIIGKAAAMDGAINANIKSVGTNYEEHLECTRSWTRQGRRRLRHLHDGAGAYTCAKY